MTRRAVLLITGSRAYPGGPAVGDMVRLVLKDFAARHVGKELILIHGDCPHPKRNAQQALSIDQVAVSVGSHLGFRVIARPANWAEHGRRAGPIRNTAMVAECAEYQEAGDTVEVAGFPYGEARGTKGCLSLARQAGLKVGVHGG
jgi:hypothetical protein